MVLPFAAPPASAIDAHFENDRVACAGPAAALTLKDCVVVLFVSEPENVVVTVVGAGGGGGGGGGGGEPEPSAPSAAGMSIRPPPTVFDPASGSTPARI